ncbi:MAG: hypothetical protein QOK33_1161, partial [Mycobacterium sp.]|nr:hypothetical protein [Mycobacterium sp.]
RSPRSGPRPGWCNRCARPPARARRTRCARCAPRPRAPARKSWFWRRVGKAVDEALHDDAGDRGYTIAKALHLMQQDELQLNRRCVIVVDEASMVATPDFKDLLTERC